MARLRSAPRLPATQPATTRKALNDRTNVTRSQAHVYDDDGSAEGMVKDAKTRRGRAAKQTHKSDDLAMAGGLGKRSGGALASETAARPAELAGSDGPRPPTAKPNKRPARATREVVQSQAKQAVREGLKKRMEQTAGEEGGRTAAVAAAKPAKSTRTRTSTSQADNDDDETIALAARNQSGFDVPVSPSPPGKLTSLERTSLAPPSSALRPQPTPAMDTSVLKNFRRRPRQPSMLALVQQRLASAQPSMIEAQPAEEDPTVFDFEASDDDEIEDDFAPEAEGTPMRWTKAKRKSAGSAGKTPAKLSSAQNATSSRKRRSPKAETPDGALESLRTKRRRSTVSAAPVNSPRNPSKRHEVIEVSSAAPTSSTNATPQPTPEPQRTSEVQVLNSQQSSPPTAQHDAEVENSSGDDLYRDDFAIPSTEEQLRQNQAPADGNGLEDDDVVPDATIAEPASSSPALSFPPATQADPLSQVSPPPPVRRRPPKQTAKPMTTSALQSLLPKRRQPLQSRHGKSEYDFTLESDGEQDLEAVDEDDDDDDEAGEEAEGTVSHRRRQTKSKSTATKGAATAKAAKSRRPTAPPPPPPPSPPAAASSSSSSKGRKGGGQKPTRTYGRAAHAASKQEKRGTGFEARDGDDGTAPPTAMAKAAPIMSAELEAAKRRFAEIDQWALDFESLGDEEHRSSCSSQGWR